MKKALGLVIVLFAPYLITVGAAMLFMQPLSIKVEYSRPGFPPDRYGFTKAERYRLAVIGLESVVLPGKLDDLAAARTDDGKPAFNQREVRHMTDVRRLVARLQALWVAMAVLAIAATFALKEGARKYWGYGGVFTLATLVVLTLLVWWNFDWFFTEFHHLFFQGNTWLFPETDTLIRLYPWRFWNDLTWGVGITAIVVSALLAIYGFVAGR